MFTPHGYSTIIILHHMINTKKQCSHITVLCTLKIMKVVLIFHSFSSCLKNTSFPLVQSSSSSWAFTSPPAPSCSFCIYNKHSRNTSDRFYILKVKFLHVDIMTMWVIKFCCPHFLSVSHLDQAQGRNLDWRRAWWSRFRQNQKHDLVQRICWVSVSSENNVWH